MINIDKIDICKPGGKSLFGEFRLRFWDNIKRY
jgi:hypothetical protein